MWCTTLSSLTHLNLFKTDMFRTPRVTELTRTIGKKQMSRHIQVLALSLHAQCARALAMTQHVASRSLVIRILINRKRLPQVGKNRISHPSTKWRPQRIFKVRAIIITTVELTERGQ